MYKICQSLVKHGYKIAGNGKIISSLFEQNSFFSSTHTQFTDFLLIATNTS